MFSSSSPSRPRINPEIERRFLTDTIPFPHTPALLGAIELEENGVRSAVAVVHRFVENQGDAWTVTSAYLDRFVEEQRLLTAEAAGHSD
jgi:maltose alpha-D-glucosyltransferase/alpha-amylase